MVSQKCRSRWIWLKTTQMKTKNADHNSTTGLNAPIWEHQPNTSYYAPTQEIPNSTSQNLMKKAKEADSCLALHLSENRALCSNKRIALGPHIAACVYVCYCTGQDRDVKHIAYGLSSISFINLRALLQKHNSVWKGRKCKRVLGECDFMCWVLHAVIFEHLSTS